jgi:hypothetical protein
LHTLIVFESMYGSTHRLADAIAAGLRRTDDVTVVPVAQARHERLADYELLLVGGPTHAHGMSRRSTRQTAADIAGRSDFLRIEPGAGGIGLREWFDGLGACHGSAAAFDTPLAGSALLTGRASRGIAAELERHGFRLIAEPASFLVGGNNELLPDQESAAEQWGVDLAAAAGSIPSIRLNVPEALRDG